MFLIQLGMPKLLGSSSTNSAILAASRASLQHGYGHLYILTLKAHVPHFFNSSSKLHLEKRIFFFFNFHIYLFIYYYFSYYYYFIYLFIKIPSPNFFSRFPNLNFQLKKIQIFSFTYLMIIFVIIIILFIYFCLF